MKATEIISTWKSRPDIQAEFGNLGVFASFCQNGGKIAPPSATARVQSSPNDASIKALWEHDTAIREEFNGDFDAFAAFQKADAAGCVRIFTKAAK